MSQNNLHKERVCLNRIPNVEKVHLRGLNAAISTGAETVWTPGSTYARLSSAVAFEAVSSSGNDTAAGTGARTIRVEGLDNSYNVITEDVTLAGATPVALVNTYLAINKLKVLTAGSGLTNAGTIDVRVDSGDVIKRQMQALSGFGLGQDACFHYTVPKGYLALISSIWVEALDIAGDVTSYLLTHDEDGIIRGEGECVLDYDLNVCRGIIDFQTGLKIPEKTLIELRVISSNGAGKFIASAELLLFNVKEYGLL